MSSRSQLLGTTPGRLQVILQLKLDNVESLAVGSSTTRISDINTDISGKCRPDVVADVLHLPFIKDAFGEVVFTDVIEHISLGCEPRALEEICRVLSKEGRLLMSTPNNKRIFQLLDPSRWLLGHRHYSPVAIAELLERANFRIIRTFTSGGIFAMIGVIWYSFITWPSKRVFHGEPPYAPGFLRKRERDEYLITSPKDGYTVFTIAQKLC